MTKKNNKQTIPWLPILFIVMGILITGCSSQQVDQQEPANQAPTSQGVQDENVEQLGYTASLYNTTFPSERANLNGSAAVVNAGLPLGITADQVAIDVFEMPFPNILYTRNPDELFVVGGMSVVLGSYINNIDGQKGGEYFGTPYFAKVNPSTGDSHFIELDRGGGIPYLGGALVHANGYIYVVSQSHLYKVEPESMVIAASSDLPTPVSGTIYNGILTSSTGELILKFIGATSEGLQIFLIDPDTLEITFATDDAPVATARLAVEVNDNGEEHLYHLDTYQTFRFLIEPGALTLDTEWITPYDPYETGGENVEPTSPVIVKGEVHYTTNTLPDDSTEPMRVFWQDISATYTPDMPPITGPLHFKNPGNSPGWSFSGLTADDVSGILVGNDQANGWVNAYLPKSDGEIDILWQRDLRTSNHPSIVSDREMVYVTDYVDGHNHLVVLDLLSGEELLRIPTPATRASLSNIVHTTNNETFFTSYEPGEPTGFVLRLYVPEDGAEGTVYPYTGQTNINPQVFMIITLLNLIRSPQAILILVSGVVLLVVILGFVLIQKRRHK